MVHCMARGVSAARIRLCVVLLRGDALTLTDRPTTQNLLQGLAFEGAVTGGGIFSFSPLPLFHIYGFNFSLHMVGMAGGTLVTVPRFDLERFCALVQEYGIRRAQLVPPIIIGLAKSPVVESYDLSSLETCYR